MELSELGPATLLEDLGVDSLTLLECLFKLEEEFKIKLDDPGTQIKTVQDIIDLVELTLLTPTDK